MDQLALVVDVVTVVALVGGIIFAAIELRGGRLERRRQSEVLLLNSLQSPEFLRAMRRVLDLPDGLSRAQVEEALGDTGLDLLWHWFGTLESVGTLVFNREIDIHLVSQTFGGPILLSWRKLSGYADEVRRQLGRDTMYEWFQWLAERIEALEHEEGRTPVYIRERDWKP